jgi:hypothetical protein
MTARANSRSTGIIDLRDYQTTGAHVLLFDIRRHVNIDGRQPTLAEAQALYRRWIGRAA